MSIRVPVPTVGRIRRRKRRIRSRRIGAGSRVLAHGERRALEAVCLRWGRLIGVAGGLRRVRERLDMVGI